MKIAKNDYQKILVKVQQEIQKTEKNIVQTVNRQKVEMCWEVGKIIDQHLLKNDRAEYGKKFFKQLAEDTKIQERTLYQMRSFYKAYPKLPKDEAGLNWSHYRNLSSIKDAEQRKQLEDLTRTENLDGEELRREIKRKKPTTKSSKLRVTRGKIGTYILNEFGEIDLGFNIYLSATSPVVSNISPVISNTSPVVSNTSPVISNAVRNPESRDAEIPHFVLDDKRWFTYLAELERVVDGDTIHIKLDLGFGVKHREILRLAQINAAESGTKEGDEATAELKKILNGTKFLIVKTNKVDIYGRYVADVFFDKEEKDPNKVAAEGTYLNQLLLDKGLVEVWS